MQEIVDQSVDRRPNKTLVCPASEAVCRMVDISPTRPLGSSGPVGAVFFSRDFYERRELL
jgi:hypothetical protein